MDTTVEPKPDLTSNQHGNLASVPEDASAATEEAVSVVLPAISAADDEVERFATAAPGLVRELPSPDLKALLGECRRRSTSSKLPDRSRGGYASIAATINSELVERKVAERHASAAVLEEKLPLRRRVLELIQTSPSTPTVIAATLGASPEQVSRTLTAMLRDGIVRRDPHATDGRRWIYSAADITDAGTLSLAEQRAFGERIYQPEPPRKEVVCEYLRELVYGAVRERHCGNRNEAIQRLEVAVREAEQWNLCELEILARRELMTTLRQDQRWDEAASHFAALEDYQLGRRQGEKGSFVAAIAAAHLNYERGRSNPRGKSSLGDLFRLLTAADVGYEQLTAEQPDEPEWRNRHGWAALSIADNLRKQTEFGRALRHIDVAEHVFDKDDAYGRARLLVLRGFCLRLRGQYKGAAVALADALTVIWDNGFESFEADARAQLGEVQRCLGEYDSSIKHFAESEAIADRLNLQTTRAFAESGRGAVAFATNDYDDALRLFATSSSRFAEAGQTLGEALTVHRLATTCRCAEREEFEGKRLAELHRVSMRLFAERRSPAGLATSLMERARWEISQADQHAVEQSCQQLARLILGDRANRSLLRLDTCVPALLDDFVRDVHEGGVEASDLAEAAALLSADVLARRNSARVQDEVLEGVDAQMACEPRCDSDDSRWLSAVIASAVE